VNAAFAARLERRLAFEAGRDSTRRDADQRSRRNPGCAENAAGGQLRQSAQLDGLFPPDTLTIGKDLYGASMRSVTKINAALGNELNEPALLQQEQVFRTEFEQSFADGSWRTNLPGREILRRFIVLENLPVGYEVFRNLIVSKMVERGYKPPGMKKVVDAIVAD
jgi:hypothetical protein